MVLTFDAVCAGWLQQQELISQLQEQHFVQYMQQVYTHQLQQQQQFLQQQTSAANSFLPSVQDQRKQLTTAPTSPLRNAPEGDVAALRSIESSPAKTADPSPLHIANGLPPQSNDYVNTNGVGDVYREEDDDVDASWYSVLF